MGQFVYVLKSRGFLNFFVMLLQLFIGVYFFELGAWGAASLVAFPLFLSVLMGPRSIVLSIEKVEGAFLFSEYMIFFPWVERKTEVLVNDFIEVRYKSVLYFEYAVLVTGCGYFYLYSNSPQAQNFLSELSFSESAKS
ncbi:hypothetical protein [Parathalassolituus penaei]|uniref:Uncharacterized protein n=1 Tax=Parathalassolituus penaei TaxID=2997323 RepID=A0A9X3ER14_9GAMM|nr:hypothetical protein [Parathalassolituus penaei]MCY0967318.1 hypothetical protein [Parathalassolituus penaei]